MDNEQFLELKFKVDYLHSGWRLDRFIIYNIPRLSRNKLKKIIEDNYITCKGKRITPGCIVREGEEYILKRKASKEPEPPKDIEIIYEDNDIFLLNKPAGISVHPTAKIYKNTITYILKKIYPESTPIISHRLDRETSGILLCSKNKEADTILKKYFAQRKIKKVYLAVVKGIIKENEIKIDLPLGPALGSQIKVKVGLRDDESGHKSITYGEVIERLKNYTVVSLYPHTGRQHQLRAHLSLIGYPIVGDKLYGLNEEIFLKILSDGIDKEIEKKLILPRHALHAWKIKFVHPSSREEMQFEAPIPDDMKNFIEKHRNIC